MKRKVLIATVIHPILAEFLVREGYDCVTDLHINYKEAINSIDEFEGIITSNKLPIDRELISAARRLKWVGRMGSGMEIIDVDYAAAQGIKCFSSPEGNANSVAEQALGVLLALQHRVFRAAQEVRLGIWKRDENRGYEIEGLAAGIIGYGNNGKAFADKLMSLGVNVYAYDKYVNIQQDNSRLNVCGSLDEIYVHCDIVSFHVPLNKDTYHYFNPDFLNNMRRSFVLLNLSRGEVVDTRALYQGLKTGKISGAGLDVWEREPISLMQGDLKQMTEEILKMDNFIGTPHIGGYSVQAVYKMSFALMKKIAAHIHSFK